VLKSSACEGGRLVLGAVEAHNGAHALFSKDLEIVRGAQTAIRRLNALIAYGTCMSANILCVQPASWGV